MTKWRQRSKFTRLWEAASKHLKGEAPVQSGTSETLNSVKQAS
jgi:hypothetical protein